MLGLKSLLIGLASLWSAVTAQTNSIVNFDEGCIKPGLPARCPRKDPYKYDSNPVFDAEYQGPCMADYRQCPIAQLCTNNEQTYQCPEGSCADRFENCPVKALECQYKE